ncbi:hypothetical protein [Bosea sp. AAP35]|uniref:hypothetical protein n=1 Tax=Bosea sp. AAP35 TaxID=1523417 RepID=UPI000AA9F833|nr:hypothetical protein [Bosea sp. AAP35]
MAMRQMTMVGLVAALALAGAPGAQAANLFDDLARTLFGGGQRLRATPIYEYDVPAPVQAPITRQRMPEVSSKPKPPVVQLDPATDADWYLKDPTLRRGDIVVTASGVMVFQGGRGREENRRAEFSALGGGKDAKGWKHQLEMAAAGGRSFFDQASALPKRTITVQAEAAPKR